VGAQVRSPASAATLVAHGTFRDALLDIVHTVDSIYSVPTRHMNQVYTCSR
jgi:hypothetical protein